MKFTAQEVVRGVSTFGGGNIEGRDFAASGTVFVDVQLDERKGGKGFRTEAVACDSIEVVKSVMHNTFPMKAELNVEHRATKKGTQLVVLSIKPLSPAIPKAA